MSRIAFLVVRRAVGADGGACESQFGNDTGSRVPVRLFASRAAADGCAAALVAAARRAVNLFPLLDGYLSDDTRARLAALELPVGCPGDPWHEDWIVWWDLCQDEITDEQRSAAWDVFAAAPPFEVVEVEVDDG